MKRLYADEFHPRSELALPRHEDAMPPFPVIDMHAHFGPLLLGDRYEERFDTRRSCEVLREMGIERIFCLELVWDGSEVRLEQRVCRDAAAGGVERVEASVPVRPDPSAPVAYNGHTDIPAVYKVRLKVHVGDGATCNFSYSTDGRRYRALGPSFQAREGRWIGAKAGFFAVSSVRKNRGGSLEVR